MTTPPQRSKRKRWLLIILGILIAIGATISIMADRIVEGIIRTAVKDAEMVFYGIDYQIDVGDIHTSILSGSVALMDVRFMARDTTLLDQDKDTVQIMFTFEKLRLADMDLRQLYRGDSLEIGQIDLNGAIVEVFVDMDLIDPNDLQFVPNVKEIFARNKIGELITKNATVRVKVREWNTIYQTNLEPMDLRIQAPKTLPQDSTGRALFQFDHFEMATEKMLIDMENGYQFQSGEFSINSTDSTIHIRDMDFRPKRGTPKLAEDEVRSYDWMFVTASSLEAQGFEMLDFMQNDGFHSDQVLLKAPHISMYQAYFVPDSITAARSKRLPGTIIKEMEGRFSVDRLELNNGLIEYEEVFDSIAEPIYFSVKDVDLVLNNLTQRSELLAKNDLLKVELSALIMDSVRVRASAQIPVLSPTAQFNVTAHVDSLDYTMFNPILAAERLKFKSGTMHSLDIAFSADLERSIGTMDMEFSDLHMQILKGKKILPIRLTQHNMLYSFLFNKIVKNNNSKAKKNFRQGVINVQRDPSANFLTYIYESTIAGAVSSMTGIDNSMADRFPSNEDPKSKKELRQEERQKDKAKKKKK